MSRSRPALPAAALAVSAVLAAGCTTSSGTAAGGADGAFRFAVTSDARTFDPAKGSAATDYTFARMRFANLVYRDSDDSVVPGLAATWKATPSSATFTLRDGLTCADGAPLTASTVAASLRRFADPQTGAAQAPLVFGPDAKVEVTADDTARTVTVELDEPWSDLVPALSLTGAGIVCEPGLKDPEGLGQGTVKGAGSGPYELTDLQRGRSYTFELRAGYTAFPGFEAAEKPEGERAETVRLTVVSNESTAANQLSTGALDYAAFTGPDVARFAEGGYEVHTAPLLRMFLVFNQREGRPGTDERFRKAVAQAVDPAAFNKVFGGRGEVMKSWSDGTTPYAGTDASPRTMTDPAARKVLDGVKVRLTGTNAVAGGSGNAYVQEALRAAGADVELRNVDNATWSTEVLGGGGDWDLTVMAHLNFSGTLTSGAMLLTGPPPPAGRNFGAIDDPAFARALGEAMSTTDEEAKAAAWAKAQRSALERADVVPLSTVPVAFVFGKRGDASIVNGAADPSSFRIKD
ncbi:peptide ABC transporter substrate-binding protein [Actinomadura cremea]|nr:peptide ABC transporter substrate-binding protein [Actinomadura cremea]